MLACKWSNESIIVEVDGEWDELEYTLPGQRTGSSMVL